MKNYQRQDSHQTMREALDEYFADFADRVDPDTLGENGELIRQHDAAHIVFGTSTSPRDEVLTDTWTLLGTTLSWREGMAYYNEPAIREIVSDLGFWRMLLGTLAAIPRAFRIWWRARRMAQKWRWEAWREHLDRPLADIRAEYGIRVLPAD